MPSVPICIFLDGPDDFNRLVQEKGEDLAKCADNMLFYFCYLNEAGNNNIFLDDGQINTKTTLYARQLLVPYLNNIIHPEKLAPISPLQPFLSDELLPYWILEFEFFVGVPEAYAKSLRVRSCSAKIAKDYTDFRENFWV